MLNLKTLATIACASIIVAGSMPQATYAKSSLVKEGLINMFGFADIIA